MIGLILLNAYNPFLGIMSIKNEYLQIITAMEDILCADIQIRRIPVAIRTITLGLGKALDCSTRCAMSFDASTIVFERNSCENNHGLYSNGR